MANKRDPKNLNPHPYNVRLFRQRTPSERFIRDVEKKMESPVVVNQKDEVIDGTRRWLAALELGLSSIDVVERTYNSVDEEKLAIHRHNDDRQETFSQKMRVALEYENSLAPALQKRITSGTAISNPDEDPLLELAQGGSLRKRDVAAERIGWSGSKYNQAKQIWRAAHANGNVADEVRSRAKELIDEIEDDDEDTSVYSAYQELRREKRRQEWADPVSWDTIETARVDEQFSRVDDTFDATRDSLDGSKSWSTLLDTLKEEHQQMWGEAPDEGAIHTFVYRLEESGLADLSQDEFATVKPLTDRKPDRDTLMDLYWEEEMSLTELALRYGVREEVVEYWLREEDVDRKKRELPEEVQQRIEQHQ